MQKRIKTALALTLTIGLMGTASADIKTSLDQVCQTAQAKQLESQHSQAQTGKYRSTLMNFYRGTSCNATKLVVSSDAQSGQRPEQTERQSASL